MTVTTPVASTSSSSSIASSPSRCDGRDRARRRVVLSASQTDVSSLHFIQSQTLVCDARTPTNDIPSPCRRPRRTRTSPSSLGSHPRRNQTLFAPHKRMKRTHRYVTLNALNDFSHFACFRRARTTTNARTRDDLRNTTRLSRNGLTTSRRARSARDSPCVTRGRCVSLDESCTRR